MFDKRTCRREHRGPFAAAIHRWRQRNDCAPEPPPPPPADGGDADGAAAAEPLAAPAAAAAPLVLAPLPLPAAPARSATAAFVRKRPLFAPEALRGEFDVVSVPVCGASDVSLHSCQMHPDLRRMFIRHLRYSGAVAFGAAASDDAVWSACAAPLVAAALAGAPAALFMYGQTGSGKTHTMGALEARTASALLPADEPPAECELLSQQRGVVRVSYFEIAGKAARDLLCEDPGGSEVTLREVFAPGAPPDAPGRVELLGCTSAEARSAPQLLALLAAGRARRAVSCTFANAASSRSHAVLKLTLSRGGSNNGDDANASAADAGSLTLVDCAGSERKEDSARHSAAQRKEGAEINASLYALKECIRARGRAEHQSQGHSAHGHNGPHVHVPYRSSLLTRILAEALTHKAAQLAVIGCISPAAADTEHSLTTLQTVALLAGGGGSVNDGWAESREDVAPGLEISLDGQVRDVPPPRLVPPGQWRPTELRTWLGSVCGGAFAAAAAAAPEAFAGRDMIRMSRAALSSMLCGGDEAAGGALHDAFREAVARAAAAKAGK